MKFIIILILDCFPIVKDRIRQFKIIPEGNIQQFKIIPEGNIRPFLDYTCRQHSTIFRLYRKLNTNSCFIDIVNILNDVQLIVLQNYINSQKLFAVIRANENHARN